MTPQSSFLQVQTLSRHFGGIRAVSEVSFELPRGIIFGIIGPNGAGKTTLINVLSGLIKPTSGTVTFQGERIETLPAYAVAARGITRTYQNLRLFKGVTARENVIIGQHLN